MQRDPINQAKKVEAYQIRDLKAAKRLSVEVLYGAMASFENIWAEDTLDAYVFHMFYFMVLIAGTLQVKNKLYPGMCV